MKVSPEIESLVPYVAGKPIGETQKQYGLTEVVKLASNENPLGISPKVKQAMMTALEEIHRYPDAGFVDLLKTIEQVWKVPMRQLTVGNGSNELIDLLIRVFCEPGDAILSFQYSFVAYGICAQAARVKNLTIPVGPNFEMDLEKMAEKLRARKDRIKMVFLANPNNPTGVYIPFSKVKKFLDEFGNDPDLLIVFDEAYAEFVREKDSAPMLQHFQQWQNVAVVRTLSKAYGLAGLRVGILAGPSSVVDFLNRVRNPFNVNHLAQAAAIAALQDSAFVQKVVQLTWEGLDYLGKELEKMGLKVITSNANFILFDSGRDVRKLNEQLLSRGVILRPVLNYGLPGYLRISCGTMDENRKAVKVLKEILADGSN